MEARLIPKAPPPPPKRINLPRFVKNKRKEVIPDPPERLRIVLSEEEELALRKKDVSELTDDELHYCVYGYWLSDCYDYQHGTFNFEDKLKTLRAEYPIVQNYFRQITQSEGFDLDEYPKVSIVELPCSKQPCCPNTHPDSYNQYMTLATVAIQDFNQKHGTKFVVSEVKSVNMRRSNGSTYYITFTTLRDAKTFQAEIWDRDKFNILVCRIKPSPRPRL